MHNNVYVHVHEMLQSAAEKHHCTAETFSRTVTFIKVFKALKVFALLPVVSSIVVVSAVLSQCCSKMWTASVCCVLRET